ncbi:MAG: protein TolA [Curvibacter sp. GWA2_64_110]|nr:MAG: protein TolA [Curvibacter sp. GWA2_64_110]HCY16438.1 cell envelope integrity protein TolA [Curvibacter sp.]
MHTAADRFEFAPPPPPGLMRAFSLAVVAHLLLLAALTWGVSWKRDAQTPAVEAELWSAVPQQAAPKLVEAPPEPEPKPAPPPPPKAEPVVSQADIALAREKERKAKEKLEQEKREKEKLAQLKREQEKRELEKKLAEEKKKKELEAQKKDKLKDQEEAKLREKMRQENLKRMAGLAGATGGPSSTGTALKSSGPSASYAGRIIGKIKPNIVYTDDIVGSPVAEVEVRTAPDGTIVGRKILKPSGVKAWDDAVLKAIDKTEVLPRDTDGRVPPALVITFRPRD